MEVNVTNLALQFKMQKTRKEEEDDDDFMPTIPPKRSYECW